MSVGIYKLPICDGCQLPWLPVGWTQNSDPRHLREGAKPLRCGKCKSVGWDREFVKQQKAEISGGGSSEEEQRVTSPLVGGSIPSPRSTESNAASSNGRTPAFDAENVGSTPTAATKPESVKTRCKHRMNDCPICHPKEAA